MKLGDLVRKPSSARAYGIVGVVVDVTTRISEGLVGSNWPDTVALIPYERSLFLELLG